MITKSDVCEFNNENQHEYMSGSDQEALFLVMAMKTGSVDRPGGYPLNGRDELPHAILKEIARSEIDWERFDQLCAVPDGDPVHAAKIVLSKMEG